MTTTVVAGHSPGLVEVLLPLGLVLGLIILAAVGTGLALGEILGGRRK